MGDQMKNIFVSLLLLLSTGAAFAAETGSALDVMQVPAAGGRPVLAPRDSSGQVSGIGYTISMASNAMTVSATQKDASTACSASRPCLVAFRSTTAATGGYNVRAITGALTVIAPSGGTLGQNSAVAEPTYYYVQDNAGTPQGCLSSNGVIDEGSLQTSTTIATASPTSRTTLYCTTGATGPVRKIGRFVTTQTTAGLWASAASEKSVGPFNASQVMSASSGQERVERLLAASGATITSQSGSWISGIGAHSTGIYSWSITTGTFSATPTCVCTGPDSGSADVCQLDSVTTTGFRVVLRAGTTPTDANHQVICMGPR